MMDECIKTHSHEYLSLLLKYRDKNVQSLKNGINHRNLLLRIIHIGKKSDIGFSKEWELKWFDLLSKICNQCQCAFNVRSIKNV